MSSYRVEPDEQRGLDRLIDDTAGSWVLINRLGCELIGYRITDPKSGKEQEIIFIPQKVAGRLNEYVRARKIGPNKRIFPICYEAARAMVKKAGNLVGIRLRPHDLRRHAATFASRSNVPLEIISKIILRHRHLSTTQIYLGKVSDTEAIRWLDVLYGK